MRFQSLSIALFLGQAQGVKQSLLQANSKWSTQERSQNNVLAQLNSNQTEKLHTSIDPNEILSMFTQKNISAFELPLGKDWSEPLENDTQTSFILDNPQILYDARSEINPQTVGYGDKQHRIRPSNEIMVDGKFNFTSAQVEAITLWKNKQDQDKNIEKDKKLKKMANDYKLMEKHTKPELPEVKGRTNQDKKLTVHMIAHTHNDMGWLKTYNDYFSGSEAVLGGGQNVHDIIDNVINELTFDKDLMFTYVEMKYFQMWYEQQNDKKKTDVKQLMQEGRFEITMGGWVGPEENDSNYEDIIGVFQLGHKWLLEEFGVAPRVGWNLDPFGHTEANAALFHDFGFDAFFFSRITYDKAKIRMTEQESSHFLWRPLSNNFGKQKQILTGLIANGVDIYSMPAGFQYDQQLYPYKMDSAIQYDQSLVGFDQEVKAHTLINKANEMANGTASVHNILYPLGDDWAYENAYTTLQNLKQLIAAGNKYGEKWNVEFKMSTPSKYVDSLMQENVTWPVMYDDLTALFEKPELGSHREYWSGYYSSRPDFKKQIKEASNMFYAESKLHAKMVLNQNLKDDEIKGVLDSNFALLQEVSIDQHHDAIAGTALQYVTNTWQFNLKKAEDMSLTQTISDLQRQLIDHGILAGSILMCKEGAQNDTVKQCPVSQHEGKDFIVAVQNSQIRENKGMIRVLVPSLNYSAQIWDAKTLNFIDTPFDINENKHFDHQSQLFSDYEIFLKGDISADDLQLVKILAKAAPAKAQSLAQANQRQENGQSLEVMGFSKDGEVIFKYINEPQGIEQSFSVGVKKYIGHQKHKNAINRDDVKPGNKTQAELYDQENAEGLYLFIPEWRNPLPQQYGKLDTNVIYEKGQFLDQWTIVINDDEKKEKALIKIRKSDSELIECDVELAPVSNKDGLSKDIIVSWKMYNGFSANKTFWTDSNSLAMIKRKVSDLKNMVETIAGSYYPVTSAIAMRNINSTTQVTVMNDRTQGGTADLMDSSAIELMQHRQILDCDNKGNWEDLQELGTDDIGIRVNARYQLQIFDTQKGKSQQRSQQINQQNPLNYFFIFDYEHYVVKPSLTEQTMYHYNANLMQLDTFADQKSMVQALNTTNSYAQFAEQGQMRILPYAKNQILVRLENLGDRFDASTNQIAYFNLEKLAGLTYFEANNANASSVFIEEQSIQGTQSEFQLSQKQAKWIGADDDNEGKNLKFNQAPLDYNNFQGVALEPQRIRTFLISYNLANDTIKSKNSKMHQLKVLAGLEKDDKVSAPAEQHKENNGKTAAIVHNDTGKKLDEKKEPKQEEKKPETHHLGDMLNSTHFIGQNGEKVYSPQVMKLKQIGQSDVQKK